MIIDLTGENSSYMIVSTSPFPPGSGIWEREASMLQDALYARDYTLISMTGYCGGMFDKSYLAINKHDNDSLRMDAVAMAREGHGDGVVVKYRGESQPVIVRHDGSESPMSFQKYTIEEGTRSYMTEGSCFSLKSEPRYRTVESRSEIRKGMTLEYQSANGWVSRVVEDPDLEYEDLYRLLMKYGKLRTRLG